MIEKKQVQILLLGLLIVGAGVASGVAWRMLSHNQTAVMDEPISWMPRRGPGRMIKSDTIKADRATGRAYRPHYTMKDLKALIARLETLTTSEQIKKELEKLLKCSDSDALRLAANFLFSHWGKINSQDAINALKGISDSWVFDTGKLTSIVLEDWISKDPAEVYAFYLDDQNGLRTCNSILSSICEEWAKKSPEEAWRWLSSLNNKEQITHMEYFFTGVLKDHPEQVEEFMNRLFQGKTWPDELTLNEKGLISDLIEMWTSSDPDAAWRWLSSQTDSWKNRALLGYALIMGLEDPFLARERVAELKGGDFEGAYENINFALFQKEDMDRILSWVEQEGDAIAKTSAAASCLNWHSSGFVKELIGRLPESEFRDDLILEYVNRNIDFDYEQVMLIAGKIKDEDKREEALNIAMKNREEADR